MAERKKAVAGGIGPWAGRAAHSPVGNAAPVSVVAPAAVVAAAPTPSASRAKHPLRDLPRFRPPAFDEAAGLPCPDSPGSTPRDHGEDDEVLAEPPRSVAAEASFRPPVLVPAEEGTAASGSLHDSAESQRGNGASAYAVGSVVEYKSRSSGLWILARVEGYDETTQVYRLDVQPNARPERIRPRSGSQGAEAEASGRHQQPQQAVLSAQGPPAGARSPLQPPSAAVPSARGCSVSPPAAHEDLPSASQELAAEAQDLRRQCSWLQAANEVLRDQLLQETDMKDRFYQDLADYREQLQMALPYLPPHLASQIRLRETPR